METAKNVQSFELLRVGQRIDQIYLHPTCWEWKIDVQSSDVEIKLTDGARIFVVADDRLPSMRCSAEPPAYLRPDRALDYDNWTPQQHLALPMRMEIPYRSLRDSLRGQAIEDITVYEAEQSSGLVRRIVLRVGSVIIEIGYDAGINTLVSFSPA